MHEWLVPNDIQYNQNLLSVLRDEKNTHTQQLLRKSEPPNIVRS